MEAQESGAPMKRRSRKKLRIALIAVGVAVLAVAARVLIPMLVNSANRSKAEECFAAGRYAEAAAYYQKLGDEGHAQWAECIHRLSVEACKNGAQDEAITYAEQLCEDSGDNWKAAALGHAGDAAAQGAYPLVCHYAMRLFRHAEYTDALKLFRLCGGEQNADANAAVLDALLNERDCILAATLAKEAVDNGKTEISADDWKAIVTGFLPEASDDLNEILTTDAVEVVFREGMPPSEREQLLKNSVPTGDLIEGFTGRESGYFVIESADALRGGLYGRIGTQPNGKVLIVVKRSSTENACAVSRRLMKALPLSLYPQALDEVEYLVLLSYGKTLRGNYTGKGMVSAYQEYASVTVTRIGDGSVVYSSPRIDGKEPPKSIDYTTRPSWVSGGAPDMGEELCRALLALLPDALS